MFIFKNPLIRIFKLKEWILKMDKGQLQLKYTQNFLQSSSLIIDLIEKTNLTEDDYVLEIGSGKGIITRELAEMVKQVVAIEYDQSLCRYLNNMFLPSKNVEIIEQNFLNYSLPKNKRYKVFASIPFNITAEIIKKLTEISRAPEDSYLIIQKEAAWKYTGQSYYKGSLRSLLLKPYFEFEIIHRFKRKDFRPIPDVDIVMLHIKKRRELLIKEGQGRLYQDFLAYIFSQNNNGLKNKCKNIFSYRQFKRLASDNGFKMKADPTDLNFEQWFQLFCFFSSAPGMTVKKRKLVNGAYSSLLNQ